MNVIIPFQVSEEFRGKYFDFFFELSKEAFEAAKRDSGVLRYMTKKQCCEFMGISFCYLQKLEKFGLPIIELEGKLLVDREDVIKFMNKYKRVENQK